MNAAVRVLDWTEFRPSVRVDVMSFVFALAIHAPLYFMKMDIHKPPIEQKSEKLISDVTMITELPKKEEAPPPPPPAAKKNSFMDRMKALVKTAPPPPPPPLPKVAKPVENLATGPKEIKLDPKLNLPEKINPALQSKAGFKTAADAKLVEDRKIQLKAQTDSIAAPLTERKLGIVDKGSIKSDKGNFQIAKGETLRSIGGSGPAISDGSPAIAIAQGSKGTVEKFSAAPPPMKSDKGRLGSVSAGGLGDSSGLSLRDRAIAREAAAGRIDIASSGGAAGGVAGGVPGGVPGGVVGSKRDAGRFSGTGVEGGVLGGTGTKIGGTGTGTGSGVAKPIAAKPAQKKSMFTITGELKDRKIVRQVLPEYPDWAQAQGIEAAVILEFTVDPQGNVKDLIRTVRTSGYNQLDEAAKRALRNWKFVPLDDENRNEVGQITFNFSLS